MIFLSIASGSRPEIDRLRKKIISIFKNEGLKIVCEEAPGSITNFLDICLNLETKGYKPYKKPGDQTLFISVESYHPPNIIRQLPKMVKSRIEKLCSDEEAFTESKSIYLKALKEAGFRNTNFTYDDDKGKPQEQEKISKKKARKVYLFKNCPWTAIYRIQGTTTNQPFAKERKNKFLKTKTEILIIKKLIQNKNLKIILLVFRIFKHCQQKVRGW